MLSESSQPFVSYILGMYGHIPFHRNMRARPTVIEITPHIGEIHRIANQFYYRTQALGRYLSQLAQVDPDAIIYITSDHLPAVINSKNKYQGGYKHNISLLRVGSSSIDVSSSPYHTIPRKIWSFLTDDQSINIIKREKLETYYYAILAQSFFKYPHSLNDSRKVDKKTH